MTDRHDPVRDAERVVLGAMMLDPGVIEAVTATLRSPDFGEVRHGSIYAAITANYAGGADTGPAAIALTLDRVGEMQRVGGGPYLHELVASVPTVANAGWYAEQVRAASLVRAARVEAARLSQVTATGDLDQIAVERSRLVDSWTEDTSAADNDGWAPVDLNPYIAGTVEQAVPTVGISRRDGLRLIYAGREHTVIGEMESAKTWLAAASVAAELDAGNRALYVHFEEPEPADLIGRLLALGTPGDAVLKQLRFVAPNRPVTQADLARLLDPAPSLVVLDGVNEGMSLHGWAIREEDGAAMFRRHLVMPCIRVGAATLGCDHVIKDSEKRAGNRYAIGSIHKGNGISGAIILLENVEPFGRGRRGASHVYITKDRPGHLRQHGQPTKLPGKTYMGTLVVDDEQRETPDLQMLFLPPSDKPTTMVDPVSATDDAALAAVARVIATGITANLRAVRAASGLSHDVTDQALARLVLDGRLLESSGKRGARVFTVPEDHSPEGAE